MLSYEQGLALAQEHAPELLVDPHRTNNPHMFVLRKVKNGPPFSIHLPSTPANISMTDEEKAESEKSTFIDALKAAKEHFNIGASA